MADIQIALPITLQYEGGYSNNLLDPGGITNYGVTAKTAASFGYTGDMHDIPIGLVVDIYKNGYWDILKLDEMINQDLANNVFDFGVNAGTHESALTLQRSVNMLGRVQLTTDGNIGSATLTEVNSLDADSLINNFQSLRVKYYQALVIEKPSLQEFLNDWVNRASLKV